MAWDQGNDFLSHHMTEMCDWLTVPGTPYQAYMPEHKGRLERGNGVVQHKFVRQPGWTGDPKDHLGNPLMLGRPSDWLTRDEFEEGHAQIHPPAPQDRGVWD